MGVQATGEGLRAYYKGKIEDLEIQIRDKQHNLWRMEAQRNDLNLKGKYFKKGYIAVLSYKLRDKWIECTV